MKKLWDRVGIPALAANTLQDLLRGLPTCKPAYWHTPKKETKVHAKFLIAF